MFKKILATFATLLLAAGLSVVAVAAPASAHDVNDSVTCNTLTVEPKNYETKQGNSKPNSIIVTIDSKEVLNTTFGSSLTKQTFTYDGTQAHTWSIVIDAHGGNNNTQYDVNKSGTTTPCAFDWNWQYAAPTCDALTVLYPANIPAGQANDANVKIKYGPNYGNEITLNFHNNGGTWSGTQVFTYSTHPNWPANIGKYKVVWTQVAGTNYHWQGEVKCGSDPQDATATVNTTPATCDAAEAFVDVSTTNATYVVEYPTATTYKVTATAAAGHLFSNGTTTLVINGSLAPQQTQGCAAPPECLPRSNVAYTYDPATNSGVVTVTNPNPSKYTNDLCQGFWVTAASWFYTTGDVWPQIRNQVNKLDKITSVGTYPYHADVVCGQGDIYASFTAQPDPTFNLYGPSNPFPETFLHNMGFSGPSPTWTQTGTGCNDAPVEPATAKAITECGTYGSVHVPADTAKIDYTLTGNGQTGVNTVTAVAIAPYVLKNYPAGGWTFNLGSYTDCELTVTLTYVPDCAVDETNTWKIYNPGEESVVVSFEGGTHTATPGYSTLETAASDAEFTITWGATGSGIKPGEASVTPGADLPADDPACVKLAEPVAPEITVVTECGVYGTVTPVEKTGVVYDVDFDKETGIYTVTATPAFGYYFAGDAESVVYEGTVGEYYACVEEPDASVAYGECVYYEDGSIDQRHVSITFDNTGSNKPVYFEVPYFSEYNQLVPAGQKVTFDVADIWPAGGGYDVVAAGQTFHLDIPGCDLPTLPEPIKRVVDVPAYDCSTTTATVTTTEYTTNWTFDTETLQWVKLPEVAGTPVVTTRPMTEQEITDEVCLVVVTDPEASTCLNQTDETLFSSWIRVALDPNVEYRIDGVLATTEYVEVSPGVHTVTADALNGFTLSGGNPTTWTDTHHEWEFTAVDFGEECQPTLSGSTAAGECVANAPWIFFDVALTDPAGIATSNEAHLIMSDGTNTEDILLGTLGADGTLSGKVLWPGAAVGPDGVTPTAWPGWEQTPEGEWVTTTGNYAWTRTLSEVTLSVNPSIVVELKYPPATPDCFTDPPEPPTLATVTPEFSYTPLTCTAAGSYTLGELAEDTIQWTVNGNPIGVGTYPVTSAQTLTFVATPLNEEDGLDPDWVQPDPIAFSQGSAPCDLTTLALTGAANSFGLIWAALLLGLTGIGFVLIRRRTATEK